MTIDELDARAVAEHIGRAGVEQPPKAVVNPDARGPGRLYEQPVLAELARLQRLEPDAVRALVDGERELGSYARPYVLELFAHGSVDPLLSQS